MEYRKQTPGFSTKAVLGARYQYQSRRKIDENQINNTTNECSSDPFFLNEPVSNVEKEHIEICFSLLENAKYALAFSSGLSAITSVFNILRPRQHVVVSNDISLRTAQLMREVFIRIGVEFSFVCFLDCENLENAMRPNTKMVFIETPTNPLLNILDIELIAKITHRQPGALLIVDNTIATPCFQRPIDLGADATVASFSMSMSGLGDVTMGAVTTNCKSIYRKLRKIQILTGNLPSSFDCILMMRSLKTLQLCMNKHAKSALCVAKFLEANASVQNVNYPGLKSHPDYELNRRQCYGTPGIIIFYLNGQLQNAKQFLESLKLFKQAEYFGGPESAAFIPYTTTHSSLSEETKEAMGITENLICLSIGLEDIHDIIVDLNRAIKASQ